MNRRSVNGGFLSGMLGFPPPQFLCMPAVGLNISDHSIKILELISKDDYLIPGRYFSKTIPEGVITSGIVKNDSDFVAILRKLKNDLDLKLVRASVPEENAYSFNLTLPKLNDKELYDSIKFQLSEYVPLSSEESVFDYDILKIHNDKVDLSVSVLPKRVVDQYITFFSAAGLIPIAFEIEAQTLARAVIPKGSKKKEVSMIVDIGRTRTGVSIVSGTVVNYTSTLEMGGDSFITSIQKDLGISFQEAEKIKQTQGLIKQNKGSALEDFSKIIEKLRDELLRRFDYWDEHIPKGSKSVKKAMSIDQVILCGGNATTPGLKEYLSSGLGVPVNIGNVWTNVFSLDDYIPEIDFNHSLGFASAIGLSLSNEI